MLARRHGFHPKRARVPGGKLDASGIAYNKVAWLCHRRLTPEYRQLVAGVAASKRVHHLKSPADIKAFLDAIKGEYAAA